VVPVLVPSDGPVQAKLIDGVHVVGPSGVHALLHKIDVQQTTKSVRVEDFLQDDAYAPMPTIVQAARELYHGRELPFIKRARAATDPAIDAISEIAHAASELESRHLVLVSGVPGAGKTLVGLQVVHAGWLDDLVVERANGRINPKSKSTQVTVGKTPGDDVPAGTHIKVVSRIMTVMRKAGAKPGTTNEVKGSL
jgi:hypothetical protein